MTAKPDPRSSPPAAGAPPSPRTGAGRRQVQLARRRPPRRETCPDTTLTDTWPARLNISL